MHDLRLAVRALRATPVVSLVAALSLALGIGANTAIFSLVNSLLLRALPVPEGHWDELRDPAKQGSNTTIETVWQMPGGDITKGTYVGAPGRWMLQASGAPVKPEMAAQLDAIEARSLAERIP